jgi:transcriptional regulator GlxA family with amidase domain
MKRIVIFAVLFLAAFTVAAQEKKYTRNVAVVVYKDAEPLDWTGPYEVYHDAAGFGGINGKVAFNVYIVATTKEPVNAQGLVVVPTYSIENAPRPDIIIIPGGNSNNVLDDAPLFAWTKKAMEEAEITQTVCSGAFVAAKAGLLDNLEVTTWYGAVDRLAKSYPKLTVGRGRRFVDNGRIVTTAGVSAGIDGSLHVIARLLGRRTADQVATYMEYRWTPETFLTATYSYLNPSTDEAGRLEQAADMAAAEKNWNEAARIYRTLLERQPGNKTYKTGLATVLKDSAATGTN